MVSCAFSGTEPVRYPSISLLEGIGRITSCYPSDPQTCRIETDLEVYNVYSGLWGVYASGDTSYGPPCQGKKSIARNYGCTSTSTPYSYRTRTYVTIVEDGHPASGVQTTATRSYYCN